jgi:L-lactate utilization protein LutC
MDRERFLEGVAGALRSGPAHAAAALPSAVAGTWSGPTDRDAMVELFVARLAELGGSAIVVSTRTAAQCSIEQMLKAKGGAVVACAPGLSWPGVEGVRTHDARTADFGLSEADWGIAETGSVVLCHRGERGRGYSLIPPAAGFLLPVSRLVPRLGAVLTAVHRDPGGPPACITFISGPSHSGDIGGIMCSGVHGPGEVHVWLIDGE